MDESNFPFSEEHHEADAKNLDNVTFILSVSSKGLNFSSHLHSISSIELKLVAKTTQSNNLAALYTIICSTFNTFIAPGIVLSIQVRKD